MGLLRKPKFLLTLAGIVAGVLVGRLYFSAPVANISLPAEPVIHQLFGFWDVTNSLIAAWIAIGILLLVTYLATRRMSDVPGRWQGLMESILEFAVTNVEGIIGHVWGRRVFPLIMTLFLFIVVANWSGLLPFYNVVGNVEPAEEIIAHKIEAGFDDEHAKHEAEELLSAALHEVEEAEAHDHGALPVARAHFRQVAEEQASHAGVDLAGIKLDVFSRSGRVALMPLGRGKKETTALAFLSGRYAPDDGERLEDAEAIDLDQKSVGHLIPWLRSANSDLMVTIALTLVTMVLIEFWGIRANGLFGYAGRFFNVRALMRGKVIDFLVGGLEAISEVAKLISFSFRLFGNIFAGEVLIFAVTFLLPFLVGVIAYGLEVFVGFIQAVVFAVLALIFTAQAVTSHESEEEAH